LLNAPTKTAFWPDLKPMSFVDQIGIRNTIEHLRGKPISVDTGDAAMAFMVAGTQAGWDPPEFEHDEDFRRFLLSLIKRSRGPLEIAQNCAEYHGEKVTVDMGNACEAYLIAMHMGWHGPQDHEEVQHCCGSG
jgi:hypothetical protein